MPPHQSVFEVSYTQDKPQTTPEQQARHDGKRARTKQPDADSGNEEFNPSLTKRSRLKIVSDISQSVSGEDHDEHVKHSIQQIGRPDEPLTSANIKAKLDVNELTKDRYSHQTTIPTFATDVMTSKVFHYSFIVQLVLENLTDHEVLARLILTSRAVNRSISRYLVKMTIDRQKLDRISRSAILPNDLSTNHFITSNHRLVITQVHCRINERDPLGALKSWLPVTVKKLTIITSRQLVPGDIPSHITNLTVLSDICSNSLSNSQSIVPGVLHEGIESLNTNHILCRDSIPSTVEQLDWDFTSDGVDIDVIPDTVKVLSINVSHKNYELQNILRVIPSTLTKLAIRGVLDKGCCASTIPASVKDLKISLWIPCPARVLRPTFFPVGLEKLEIEYLRGVCVLFPSNVFHRHFARAGTIPDTVTELIFEPHYTDPAVGRQIQIGDLPPLLRVLDLGGHTRQLLPGVLPSTLRKLTLRGNNDGLVLDPGVIPSGVTYLTLVSPDSLRIPKDFQQILPGVIPSSVVHLEWDYHPTKRPLKVGAIPSSVRTLIFGISFNRVVPVGFIPNSVRSLTFGDSFCNPRPLKIGVIPFGVKYLQFGRWFDNGGKPMQAGVIPATVTHISFPRFSMFSDRDDWCNILPHPFGMQSRTAAVDSLSAC